MTEVIEGITYNLKVPRAKGFMYQGVRFIPFHKFMGGAARFEVVSKRLTCLFCNRSIDHQCSLFLRKTV